MPVKPDWLPAAAFATNKGWVVAHPDGTEEVMIAVNGLLPYVPPVVVVEPTPTVNVQAVRFGEINGQSVVKIFFSGATTVTGTASIELKSFKETITVPHSAFLSTPTTLVFPFNVPANTLGLTILEQEIKGQIQDLVLDGVGKKITKEMAIDASSSDVVSNVMVGATSTVDGVIGYVPRPVAGDDTRFLRGDGTWQTVSGSGGTSDHGALTGLSDDDHPQYLNVSRGDARYSQSAHVHAASELTEDASNRLVTDAEKAFWNGKQSALGFIPEEAANKGIAGGYASLNGAGKVPSDQLPSYIDDVLEFATFATLPIPGLSDTIYLTLSDDKTYRWSGSSYVQIATGVVDSVAGKTGLVTLDKYDVGLGNIDNTADLDKPISTATQAAINAIPAGVTSHGSLTGLGNDDHPQYHNDARGDVRYSQLTHNHTGVYQPLNPVLTNTTASFTVADEAKLDSIEANYQPLSPVLTNTTASFTTADETKLDGLGSHSTLTGLSGDDHPQYLNNTRGDARYQPLNPVLTATTASFTTADESKLDALAPMVGATALVAGVTGTVPAPAAGDENKLLTGAGSWITVSGASPMTGATPGTNGVSGLVPAPIAGDQDTKFLKADGTWSSPTQPLEIYSINRVINVTGQQSFTSTTPVAINLSNSSLKINTGGFTSTLASGQVVVTTAGNYQLNFISYTDDAGGTASGLNVFMKVNGVTAVQSQGTLTDTYTGNATISTVQALPAGAILTLTAASSDGETVSLQGYDLSIVQIGIGGSAGGGGVTDHSVLTGLADDDHVQYHNDARGDARYSLLAHDHAATYQPLSAVLTATTASFTTADETKLDGIGLMVGATASVAGASGLVPAPATSSRNKFLGGGVAGWSSGVQVNNGSASGDTYKVAMATSATGHEFFEDQYYRMRHTGGALQITSVGVARSTGAYGFNSGSSTASFPVTTDSDNGSMVGGYSAILVGTWQTISSAGVTSDYDDIQTYWIMTSSANVKYRVTVLGGNTIGFVVERWDMSTLTTGQKIVFTS